MWGAWCGWGLPLLKATGSTPRSQRKLATRPAVSERPLGFPRVAFVWSDHFPSDGSWSCLWCGLLVSTHHAAAPSPGASGIRRPPWAMGMPLPHGRDTSPRSMVCCWVTLPLVSASGPLETLPCCVPCRAIDASACGAPSLRGVSRRLSAPQHLLVPVPVPDGSSGTCSPQPSGVPSTGDGRAPPPPARDRRAGSQPGLHAPFQGCCPIEAETFVGPGLSSRSPPGALPHRETPDVPRPALSSRPALPRRLARNTEPWRLIVGCHAVRKTWTFEEGEGDA
jgi:hypothetical protein